MPAVERLHGTLVADGRDGVLLRGPSGSGKSDLALRLMAPPWSWQLVADDQIILERDGDTVVGTTPLSIAGKLEVRGIGIVAVSAAASARVRLIVDLVPRSGVPRLPEPATETLLDLPIPVFRLHAFEASAPHKVAVLLQNILAGSLAKN